MDKTILQIPVSKELRNKATKAAENLGFSSLQETVRVFLTQLSTGQIRFHFGPPSVTLTPQQVKRYNRILQRIEFGQEKIYAVNDKQDLLDQLYESDRKIHSNLPQALPKKNSSQR